VGGWRAGPPSWRRRHAPDRQRPPRARGASRASSAARRRRAGDRACAAIASRRDGLGERAISAITPARGESEVEDRPRRIEHGLGDRVRIARLAAHGHVACALGGRDSRAA